MKWCIKCTCRCSETFIYTLPSQVEASTAQIPRKHQEPSQAKGVQHLQDVNTHDNPHGRLRALDLASSKRNSESSLINMKYYPAPEHQTLDVKWKRRLRTMYNKHIQLLISSAVSAEPCLRTTLRPIQIGHNLKHLTKTGTKKAIQTNGGCAKTSRVRKY